LEHKNCIKTLQKSVYFLKKNIGDQGFPSIPKGGLSREGKFSFYPKFGWID
jgi:hypothetical protein